MKNKKILMITTIIFLVGMLSSCDIYFTNYIPSWMEGTWEDDAVYKTSEKIGTAEQTTDLYSSSYKFICNSNNYILYAYENGDTSNVTSIMHSTMDKDILNFVKKYSNISTDYSTAEIDNSQNITSGFSNQYTTHTSNNFSFTNTSNKNVDVSYTFDITITPVPKSSTKMYLKILMESNVQVEDGDLIVYKYGFDSFTDLPLLQRTSSYWGYNF